MKKLILLTSSLFVLSFCAKAQNVANTYWQAYDTTNSPELYWYFDNDTCWFSVNGIDYDSISTFTETSGQFFITDINFSDPSYCGGLGIYNKMFSADTMWQIPVSDTCSDRNDYFAYRYFISLTSGLEQQQPNVQFSIYPNPNSGTFIIASGEIVERIVVRDVFGKIVDSEFYLQNNTMELRHPVNGIYFVTITHSNGTSSTQKIVVEH